MELGHAISIAAKAFEGKFDKSGEPYILHCLQVMNNVDKWNDMDLKTIAVLHDLAEDTNHELVNEDERFFIVDTEFNIAFESTKRIVVTLNLLTHRKGVPYDEYIDAICTNQDAIKVKMADIEHNSSILRLKGVRDKDLERIAKYHRSYLKLKENLL